MHPVVHSAKERRAGSPPFERSDRGARREPSWTCYITPSRRGRVIRARKQDIWFCAGMAKLADAADLKSAGPKGLWGFKSPSRHQLRTSLPTPGVIHARAVMTCGRSNRL